MVDLYDRGMREPPPLSCMASAAYAAAAAEDGNAEAAGRGEWESAYSFDKEDRAPEHRLVLGGVLGFADLLAAPPRDDERGDGWDESDPSRFGRWSRRLWAGLLEVEEVRDL
jgi:exodeoxyribonuclease V gamma subunit